MVTSLIDRLIIQRIRHQCPTELTSRITTYLIEVRILHGIHKRQTHSFNPYRDNHAITFLLRESDTLDDTKTYETLTHPDAEHVQEQFDVIVGMLARQLPKVKAMLREAKDNLLAFTSFPQVHWRKIWSTNPLEHLNKENKSSTDVVGVFPDLEALLRLAGEVLAGQHDEWAARRPPPLL